MSRAGLVQQKGAAVTFTKTTPGSRNRTAGTFGAPSKSTVKGYAMRVPGDVETYKALELIESESLTMEFVPTTAGETPEKDSTVEFGDYTYTVRSVEPVGLGATPEAARVVASR